MMSVKKGVFMNMDQILQSPGKVEAQALNDLKKPVS